EEGPRTFGSTEFDGQSLYAEIPLRSDNSFSASVPGNVPFHIQLVDKFGMSIANESIWISGRAGEQRPCGGCHENRLPTPELSPMQVQSVVLNPVNLDTPRAQRVSPMGYQMTNGTFTNPSVPISNASTQKWNLRGIPWDLAVQPIFDAKCVS